MPATRRRKQGNVKAGQNADDELSKVEVKEENTIKKEEKEEVTDYSTHEQENTQSSTKPARRLRTRTTKHKEEESEVPKSKRAKLVKEEVENDSAEEKPATSQRSARTKKIKKETGSLESDIQKNMRLTVGAKVLEVAGHSKKNLGVHASAAGSVDQAIYNAMAEGCRSFALFLRNQRRWDCKPMEEIVVERWQKAIAETQFPIDQILPHGSYLMNPGCPDADKLEKTRVAMLDECQRAERLDIKYYNFHPGSSIGQCTREECIATVAATIDYVVERTQNIIMVIETMAGQGHTVGGTFEEIRAMIDAVKDKTRVGVCIDTCHIFAAGYDIRTPETYKKTMDDFDRIIGFEYLKALHINDSKGALGCKLDRHEHIGKGKIGNRGFFNFMNDDRLNGIPMVLETPEGDYPAEMMLMYKMDKENA